MKRTVLITGASRGVGKAIALELAKQHYDVALFGRNETALNEVKSECEALGATALALICDVNNENSVSDAIKQVQTHFPQLDNVIINHGISKRACVQDDKEQVWQSVMQTNLISVMAFTHQILPLVMASNHEKRAIVFTGSIASRMTMKALSAYCASKHGLIGFANSLFEDVREQGIKVTTLMPGLIKTDMTKEINANLDKMIQAQDIADMCAFVLNFAVTACPTEITIRPQRTPYEK